jgi:hypothetical protein
MAVFWVVVPCSLVEVYKRFRGPCCLHYQGRRQPSSHSPPWEPQILLNISNPNCCKYKLTACGRNIRAIIHEGVLFLHTFAHESSLDVTHRLSILWSLFRKQHVPRKHERLRMHYKAVSEIYVSNSGQNYTLKTASKFFEMCKMQILWNGSNIIIAFAVKLRAC